jgi:hypothetical protein
VFDHAHVNDHTWICSPLNDVIDNPSEFIHPGLAREKLAQRLDQYDPIVTFLNLNRTFARV